MTTIKNIRPGCVGVDLQPPLKSMRRRDDDRFANFWRDDEENSIFTRRRMRADRRFCITFAVCLIFALVVYFSDMAASMKAHGMM